MGVLVASHAGTGMKCGTGQAPVLPGPMEEVEIAAVGLDCLRGGTYCWWKGKESQNSQLFCYVKCLSVLGCFCQVIHLNPGEGTEGTLGWGWCPLEG